MRDRRAMATIAALLLAHASVGMAQSDFAGCVETIEREAVQDHQVNPVTARTLLADLTPSARVLQLDRQQPEFTSTLAGYLDRRVSESHVRQGRALLEEHQPLLDAITREYGVPGRYLIAFWGLETNYGQYTGRLSTLQSLATLACDPRRADFFRGELIAALQLVDQGTVQPDQLRGSWAGALGNFQFLPSVYRDYAVDASGDGRADLWESFEDAAVSAANFLKARGWQAGERWGREVLLPADFDLDLLEQRQPLEAWADAGLQRADGAALPVADLEAQLLLPAGVNGPAFLVYENFDVIMRWNPSRFYALAVGRLADRLAGADELTRPPPATEPLAIETVQRMQEQLNALGFDAGEPDGRIGPVTRSALRAFQQQRGIPADGFPDEVTRQRLDEQAREI